MGNLTHWDYKQALDEIADLKRDKSELLSHIAELEKDVAFLQSCVNSGETATKADYPNTRIEGRWEQGE